MIPIKSPISNLRLYSTTHSAISTSDRRWVLCFAALIMLVTTVPYLVGYASQGRNWVFSGFVFGVEDGNSYLGKMMSGAAGAWSFRTPFTAYPQKGIVAFLPYLLIGKLASAPGLHLQLAVLFHLFRIGSGFLAILATYDFLAFTVREKGLRRFGLALAVVGGGLGWVLVLLGRSSWLGSLPLDFYSPETFGFLSLYGVPHLALARAALLWGLLAYLQSARTWRRLKAENHPFRFGKGKSFRSAFKIGVFWLLAALAQPITALIFGGVIVLHLAATALWLGWRRRGGCVHLPNDWQRWKSSFLLASWAAALPAPFLLYNTLAFSFDPFLKAWTAQNLILSPHPLHYLLAYGLLTPYIVMGARRFYRRRPWAALFLIAWVSALPFLAYAPVNLQRRLPEGIWVAAVVLAMAALSSRVCLPVKSRETARLPVPWLFFPLLLLFPSALLLLSGGILAATHPSYPIFRPTQEVEAFQFLQENAARGEVVLSSYGTGNALPAWAPLRTVIGHGPESVGLASLLPRVARFYSAETKDQERMDLLSDLGVTYVFRGPHERSLGAWNPEGAYYLDPFYSSADYQIYRVNLSRLIRSE